MSKSIQVDTKTFIRFWLVVVALVLLVLLVIRAKEGLIVIGASIFLAIAVTPLRKKIDKIYRKKSHPGLSAGLAVGGLVLVIGIIVATVGPAILSETSKFVSQAPEQIQNSLSGLSFINEVGDKFGIVNAQGQLITFFKNTIQNVLGSIPQTLFNSVGTVANFLTALILTIVLSILFMTQGPTLLNTILRKFDAKHGRATALTKEILDKIAGVVSGYVTGQLMVALIDGLVAGLAVFAISLIFGFSSGLAIPMGMLAFIFYLIPMFGPVITCVLVSLLMFFSSPWAGVTFLVFYLVFEQIQGNVIAPRVQGGKMSLPPLVILVSITLGMYMFGLIGAIISIPIAGIVKVLIDEYPKIRALSNEN